MNRQKMADVKFFFTKSSKKLYYRRVRLYNRKGIMKIRNRRSKNDSF